MAKSPKLNPTAKPSKAAKPVTKKPISLSTTATKAGKQIPSPPEPDVVIPGHEEMDPGQKLEIKIGEAIEFVADINEKIETLNAMLHSAEVLNKLYPNQVAQVTNLKDNLEQLKANALKEIQKLKKAAQEKKDFPQQLRPLFDQINSNCQNYIKMVKKAKGWLYRGASGPDAYIGRSWLARRPKDSSLAAQEVFDQQLTKLGMTALRGNSIFASGDASHASNFGDDLFVVFPIDGQSDFTYTNLDDLEMDSVWELYSQLPLDKAKWKLLKTKILKWCKSNKENSAALPLQETLEDLDDSYDDSGIWEFIDEFIGRKETLENKGVPSSLFPQSLAEFVSTPGFLKEYRPTNKNLDIAIKEHYEVYVHGKYYALSVEKFGKLIESYWDVKVDEY